MNFVFDIDGTICHDGRVIDPTILTYLDEKIHQAPSHQLIFASARPVRDILPLLPSNLHDCHVIGGNGTMLYSAGKPKWTQGLDGVTREFLYGYIEAEDLDYMVDASWNYAFSGDHLEELRKKIDILNQAKNVTLREIEEPLKVLVGNYADESKLRRDLAKLPVDLIAYPSERCLDIIARGVNKASALKQVLQDEPYVAFGNDLNDIELLRQAQIGICVGANQAIQALADRCIDTTAVSLLHQLAKFVD